MSETFSTFLAAAALAFTHALASRLAFIHYIPRSRWLSFAGGVSVAYVIVQLLPALALDQPALIAAARVGAVEQPIYVVTLLGLLAFFGVERVVKRSRYKHQDEGQDMTSPRVFWFSLGMYALINATIGYLLVADERTPLGLVLFTIALGLKFVVSDRGLVEDHKALYERYGRWIAIGAIFFGWALGASTAAPDLAIRVLRAFLAGGILMNVIKEEVPSERDSRFWAFALGALVFTLLLYLA